MIIWVRSPVVYGYCVPWSARDACHLDRFFSTLFHGYLAFVALVDCCVDHAVHEWEPVFLPKHLLRLCFAKVPRLCLTTFLCSTSGSTILCSRKISPSATDSSCFTCLYDSMSRFRLYFSQSPFAFFLLASASCCPSGFPL